MLPSILLFYPISCPMYMFSSFSFMLAFLKCLVIFGYALIFKNERQSWLLYTNRAAFLNYCLAGIVPVWELCMLVQGMPISRHHCRGRHWQLKTAECQNEGALLFGAIFILEVLNLICSCSISLEKNTWIVSLRDKCQISRNSTRNRGGREVDSSSCFGDRPSLTPHFPSCPPSAQLPCALILSCGFPCDVVHIVSCTFSLPEICWNLLSVDDQYQPLPLCY